MLLKRRTSATRLLLGNCIEQLETLPSNSVYCCVTSPPYWGLRNYNNIENQIGLEKTPELYIKNIVNVFNEVKRVLRKDGTLWLNLADTYSGGGRGGDPKHLKGDNSGRATVESYKGIDAKQLLGIPWKVALALQETGWYLRCDIIWDKPNAMPEPVTDRPTKVHEYLFLLSKSKNYYFDNEAVMENAKMNRWGGSKLANPVNCKGQHPRGLLRDRNMQSETRNIRSVWTIPTFPYLGAHFATFPEKLVEPCIKAGCPKGSIVLDTFVGSGTTGAVAERLMRSFIGIDIDPSSIELARKRIYNSQPVFRKLNTDIHVNSSKILMRRS